MECIYSSTTSQHVNKHKIDFQYDNPEVQKYRRCYTKWRLVSKIADSLSKVFIIVTAGANYLSTFILIWSYVEFKFCIQSFTSPASTFGGIFLSTIYKCFKELFATVIHTCSFLEFLVSKSFPSRSNQWWWKKRIFRAKLAFARFSVSIKGRLFFSRGTQAKNTPRTKAFYRGKSINLCGKVSLRGLRPHRPPNVSRYLL